MNAPMPSLRVFINRLMVTYAWSFGTMYVAVHWMALFCWLTATAAMRLVRREHPVVLLAGLALGWISLLASGTSWWLAGGYVLLFWLLPAAAAWAFHHLLHDAWVPMILGWVASVALVGAVWPTWLLPESWAAVLPPGQTGTLLVWQAIATWSAQSLLFFVSLLGLVMLKVAMQVPWSAVAQQVWDPKHHQPMLLAWFVGLVIVALAQSGLLGHEAWAQALTLHVLGMSWLWGVLWWCYHQRWFKPRWWQALVGLAVVSHPLGFGAGALLVPLAWVPVLRGK